MSGDPVERLPCTLLRRRQGGIIDIITVWGTISRGWSDFEKRPSGTLMLIWFGQKPRSAWCMGRGPSHVSGIASSSAGIRSWDGMRLKINDASKGRQSTLPYLLCTSLPGVGKTAA